MWVGTAQERIESIDRRLPESQPAPVTDDEGELKPDRSIRKHPNGCNRNLDLVLVCGTLRRRSCSDDQHAWRRRHLTCRLDSYERLLMLIVLLGAPH
jgi:hypothetical protein